jgi:hypothetical protein
VVDLFFWHDGLPFINFQLKFKGNPDLLQREGAVQDRSKNEKQFRLKMKKRCFSNATLWHNCQANNAFFKEI